MSGNRSKSAFFEGGRSDFRGKGASPIIHCWYQSSRVIALSCGIKISAVRHLVLSQCAHVTDGRTDRITTPKTALAYARAVKTLHQAYAVAAFEMWRHVAKFSKLGVSLHAYVSKTVSRTKKSLRVQTSLAIAYNAQCSDSSYA